MHNSNTDNKNLEFSVPTTYPKEHKVLSVEDVKSATFLWQISDFLLANQRLFVFLCYTSQEGEYNDKAHGQAVIIHYFILGTEMEKRSI